MKFHLYYQEDRESPTITLLSTVSGGLVTAKIACDDIRKAFSLPRASDAMCRQLTTLSPNDDLLSELAESLFLSGRYRQGERQNIWVVDIGFDDLVTMKDQFRTERSMSVPQFVSIR
jgi:hypothetical protein